MTGRDRRGEEDQPRWGEEGEGGAREAVCSAAWLTCARAPLPGAPSWSLKDPSCMRPHGGRINTPVQECEMTRRRCEEDRWGGDGCGWRGKLTRTCNFRGCFISNRGLSAVWVLCHSLMLYIDRHGCWGFKSFYDHTQRKGVVSSMLDT